MTLTGSVVSGKWRASGNKDANFYVLEIPL
jgi:hypothetical protein